MALRRAALLRVRRLDRRRPPGRRRPGRLAGTRWWRWCAWPGATASPSSPAAPAPASPGAPSSARAGSPSASPACAASSDIDALEPARRLRAGGGQPRPDPRGRAATASTTPPTPPARPPAPSGGNVAENSGGAHCLAYGVTTNHVLGLELVLARRETWCASGGAALDTPGYDLTGLVVGSEGTFAIVTEVTVRLMRVQEGVRTLLAIFDTMDDASRATSAIVAAGIIPAALEMMDRLTIEALQRAGHQGLPSGAQAVLLVELEGMPEGLQEQTGGRAGPAAGVRRRRDPRRAGRRTSATGCGRPARAPWAPSGQIKPNYYLQDGVIPRSRLLEVLRTVSEVSERYGLPIANVFHAGDGNLHPCIVFDQRVHGRDGEGRRRRGGHPAQVRRAGGHPLRRARHRPGEAGLHVLDLLPGRLRRDARRQARPSTPRSASIRARSSLKTPDTQAPRTAPRRTPGRTRRDRADATPVACRVVRAGAPSVSATAAHRTFALGELAPRTGRPARDPAGRRRDAAPASAAGQAVVPWGAGTKQGWGNAPRRLRPGARPLRPRPHPGVRAGRPGGHRAGRDPPGGPAAPPGRGGAVPGPRPPLRRPRHPGRHPGHQRQRPQPPALRHRPRPRPGDAGGHPRRRPGQERGQGGQERRRLRPEQDAHRGPGHPRRDDRGDLQGAPPPPRRGHRGGHLRRPRRPPTRWPGASSAPSSTPARWSLLRAPTPGLEGGPGEWRVLVWCAGSPATVERQARDAGDWLQEAGATSVAPPGRGRPPRPVGRRAGVRAGPPPGTWPWSS